MSDTTHSAACRTADPRLIAFLTMESPEIFHSVATPNEIGIPDPFDVETIHADAREAFERLLHRGSRDPLPASGAVLVLLGEAGSGKTHLMRAFRSRAHSRGWGYCAYLQMTTEASNYARYMLNNLIDGLEQTYWSEGLTKTGLSRLTAALLEAVPDVTQVECDTFREESGDLTELVDEYADRLVSTERFRRCDLALLRTLLYLERQDSRIHSRALMWLRCQAMRPQDCTWIGDAIPMTDDADPMRMLRHLATVILAVHQVPLVLLIDQLEDMANQSDPVERFLKVVDSLTAFTDSVPNAIVVLSCLEDYFKANVDKLTRAKHDRLVRDPEPIRLLGNRNFDEIIAMASRRLSYLYDSRDIDYADNDTLFPFRETHLKPLTELRARDVLNLLQRHQRDCIMLGKWVEPDLAPAHLPETLPQPVTDSTSSLDENWNTFHAEHSALVPDDEEELAGLLDDAVRHIQPELPEGFDCTSDQTGRFLELETHAPDDTADQRMVALCNANTRGPKFGKQLLELEQRAGEIPVVIVRTTEFPKSGKAMEHIARMLKRQGERLVVADADWRRILAFMDFAKEQGHRPEFMEWQRGSRPLSELESLQGILKLKSLVASPTRSPLGPSLPSVTGSSKPGQQPPPDPPPPPTPPEVIQDEKPIVLGTGQGWRTDPVTFRMGEFTQHAAFLGGSGSGKTTAALNLIEQLLARGIPAVLVDRKGDLCQYANPDAWRESSGDAQRDAIINKRRDKLCEKLDVALYTPGESAGHPLAIPVAPPGFDQMPGAERERLAQYAAGALGSMIGFKSSDADKGQKAILAKAIETAASCRGATVDLPTLQKMIKDQDDLLLNAIGGLYPDKYYGSLAERLLTLKLNCGYLLTGDETLDIDTLLGTGEQARPGRVRLSVISTRFLSDGGQVDFWVSQLLVALSRWCAKSPQPDLQAVFLFDEADIYLPAGARQPATKAPMEDLLKRARSAGVGIFLATQSPGDFDYKCKENVRTWLIGNVKQPQAIQKLKPLLASGKGNVADKLAGQEPGEFYLVREADVTSVKSDRSLIQTQQAAEHEIARLARHQQQALGGVETESRGQAGWEFSSTSPTSAGRMERK
jgi:hypothetical protein